MTTIQVTLDKEMLFDAIKEAELTERDKMEVIKILFPHRGYNDKMRLIGELSIFINENL